jgi:hypothetical protein
MGTARLARIRPSTQPEKTEPWSTVIGWAAGQPACQTYTSGPVDVPAGRAEKANHRPSALYAASSPTSVTLLRIARAAAADGAGVPRVGRLTVAEGDAPSVVGVELGVGVARGVAVGGGWLEPETGLTAGLVLVLALASGLELGGGLDAAAAGTTITNRVAPTRFEAGPIATAWPAFDGDRTSELGTVGRLARLRDIPASGAQSGSSPVGQTLFTLAVSRVTPPDPFVTTQVTWEVGTVKGVIPGREDAVGPPALPVARAMTPGLD